MRHWKLLLLLAAALALRGLLLPLPDPYDADLTTFWVPWMNHAAEHGLAQLYRSGYPPVNYPPFYLVLLTGLGKLYRLFSPDLAYTPWQSVLIKLPATLADLAVAAMLYFASLRIAGDKGDEAQTGTRLALLAAALWAFNPAVWYVSAYWAQVDAIHTMWMLACLLAALSGRWGWSGLLMGLGLATKLQAVIVLPLLLFLAWWNGWRALGRAVAGLAALVAAGALALAAGGIADRVAAIYAGLVGYYPYLTVNALNPWFLVQFASAQVLGEPLNDRFQLIGPLTLRWLGMLLLAAYGVATLWLLARGPLRGSQTAVRRFGEDEWPGPWQRIAIMFAAGVLVYAFFSLATEMHERYVLPALAFLAIPAARSRAVLLAFLALSLVTLVNLLRVVAFSQEVFRLIASIPGDRVIVALASTAVFLWMSILYARHCRPAAPWSSSSD